MIIASTARDLAVATEQSRRQGQRIALVPTMGALHRGHTSLFDIAKKEDAFVVASIFVNPRQFGDASDFNAYPITLEADLDLCRHHGVDVVYSPTASTMYPTGYATTVHVEGLTDIYEGQSRPGHFDGVTTVVTKLFNACRPDRAVFGQKDFQQTAVIRRLIIDLDLPIELIVAPTARAEDGLALSSRNIRLDTQARELATNLWRSLSLAQKQFQAGERNVEIIRGTIERICTQPGIILDYVAIVDRQTLESKTHCDDQTAILIAATIGGVRLIDNVLLNSQ